MTSRDYYRSLLQLVTITTVVTSHQIECDEQDIYAAYIKGSLDLIDGSKPFFAQYVQIEGPGRDQVSRAKYRYHWQTPTGGTRYRWDNARHHAELATFPDHVHIGSDEEAREGSPTDLWRVIALIEQAV
jgi:Family of unknown function (DUF6516)